MADIAYHFTKDPELLDKYYKMRARSFTKKWGLRAFSAQEDAFDTISDILLAMKADQCVAGARMITHQAGSDTKLPLEDGGLQVQSLLPDLNLEDKCYAEISRIAVCDDYPDKNICIEITRLMVEKAQSYGAEYIIAVSPMPMARLFKRFYTFLGFEYFILQDIVIPDKPNYEGIRMYLILIPI